MFAQLLLPFIFLTVYPYCTGPGLYDLIHSSSFMDCLFLTFFSFPLVLAIRRRETVLVGLTFFNSMFFSFLLHIHGCQLSY